MSLVRIAAGERVPERFNVVVETPMNSRDRYEYDDRMAAFRLVARLVPGDRYPADYGFIPSTMSEDGFPLDVFILTGGPAFPGCVVECRPVAVLNLSDGSRPDHKILAVRVDDEEYAQVTDLENIPAGIVDRIGALFRTNPLVSGSRQQILGWENAEAAKRVVFLAWEGFL